MTISPPVADPLVLHLADGRLAVIADASTVRLYQPLVAATAEPAAPVVVRRKKVARVVKAKRGRPPKEAPAAAEPTARASKFDWAKGRAMWEKGVLSVKGIAASLGCTDAAVRNRAIIENWGPRGEDIA